MTQQGFAALLEVSQATYTLVESGRRRPSSVLLATLERRFGVSASEIMSGEAPPGGPRALVDGTASALDIYPRLADAARVALDETSFSLFEGWLQPADLQRWLRDRRASQVAQELVARDRRGPGDARSHDGAASRAGRFFTVMDHTMDQAGYRMGSMWHVEPVDPASAKGLLVVDLAGAQWPELRKVRRLAGGRVELRTADPEHEPEVVSQAEVEIIGRPGACIEPGRTTREVELPPERQAELAHETDEAMLGIGESYRRDQQRLKELEQRSTTPTHPRQVAAPRKRRAR